MWAYFAVALLALGSLGLIGWVLSLPRPLPLPRTRLGRRVRRMRRRQSGGP
jgi:hypothetical protein